MSRETLRRLDDTGLTVRDVEFLTVGPDTGPDDWRPALAAGAALGARTFSVVGVDPDRGRLTDTLARLTADAADLRHRPDPGADQLPAGQPGRRRRRDRPRRRAPRCCSTPCTSSAAAAASTTSARWSRSRAVHPALRRPARRARVAPAARRAAAGHDGRRLGAPGRGPRPAPGRRRGRVPARGAARRRTPRDADQRRGPARGARRPPVRGRARRPSPARRPGAARPGGQSMSENTWDEQVDLLVLGTGAGGLAAAVTARTRASRRWCSRRPSSSAAPPRTRRAPAGSRTTASSGRTAPPTTREVARRYLDALVGDKAPRELRESYLRHGSAGDRLPRPDRRAVLALARRSSTTTRRSTAPASVVARWSRRRSTAGSSARRTSAGSGARCPSSRCSAAR